MIKRENLKRFLAVAFWLAAIVFALGRIAEAGTAYYVAQTAAGDGDGSSYDNRMSVATHNAATFAAGDTIYLSGTITSAIVAPSSGEIGNAITYDGYQAGTCSPISVSCSSSALLTGYSSGYAFYANGKSYIDIKDIRIDGDYTTEMGISLDNVYGIRLQGCSDINIAGVEISEIHNGIAIFNNCSSVSVIKSYLHDIAEAGIYITEYISGAGYPANVTIGGSAANGNKFKNITHKSAYDNNMVGYDVRVSGPASTTVISHNEMYSDATYWGMSGVLLHSVKTALIEYNKIHDHKSYNHRAGISIKGEQTSQLAENIVIRFNHIYNELSDGLAYPISSPAAEAIVVSGNWQHIYVYANYIQDCGAGINFNFAEWTSPATAFDGIDPKYGRCWSNIIENTTDYGILVSGASSGTDTITSIHVVNNTIFNGPSAPGHAHWASISNKLSDAQSDNIYFKNNLIYNGRSDYQGYFGQFTDTYVDYNLYYDSADSSPETYWVGSDCIPCAWNAATVPGTQDDNSVYGNPGFTNSEGHDFSLSSFLSPAYGSGVIFNGPTSVPAALTALVGSMSYDSALSPDTDWDTMSVTLVAQGSYGDWEIGAYAYTATATANGTITSPASSQTIEEGESVSFASDVECTSATPCTVIWDFNGGATNSTSEDPGAITFATAGVYNVTFTVTDNDSVSDPTPDSVTITVKTAASENDFNGNTNVKGQWLFENNLSDSSGNSNTLTGSGTPTYDSSAEIEGAYSLDLEDSSMQYASIADASLASGFTFKAATTEAPWTILAKFRLESLPVAGARMIIASKYGYTAGLRSFYLGVENVGGTVYPTFAIGYADGASNKNEFHASAVTAGVNYAIGLVFDNVTDEYLFALYNLDTGATVGTDKTGDLTSAVAGGWCNTAAAFDIGKMGPNNIYYFDGVIDEVVVLSQEFSESEISSYFAGNYSVVTEEIVRLYSSTPTGFYKEGDTTAPIFVEFSGGVTWNEGTGSITLTLINDTGNDVAVGVASPTGTSSVMEFVGLTVPDGFNTTDLDALSLNLTGDATVKVAGTATNATLTVLQDPSTRSLDSNGRIVIDDTADTIASIVGITSDASTFSEPGYIDIAVNLPSADGYNVSYVSAWPKIGLTIGEETLYAEYNGKVSATQLSFRLQAPAGARDADGIEVTGDLVLTGATLTDRAGNTVSATLPASPNTLADDSTYILAIPKNLSTGTAWLVGTGGYESWAAFDADVTIVDGDWIRIAN